MKRLLLVALVFPPAPSPGAQRPGYLARYLPQAGWEVTVLTTTAERPPFPSRVISTGRYAVHEGLRSQVATRVTNPDAALRRILRACKNTLYFPDATAPWIPKALQRGYELLAAERFDAILSTAQPPSAHVIGWLLAKKANLPWIADYRDPWAGNRYRHAGPLRTALEGWLERGILARANEITTISEPIAAQLRSFHKRKSVHVIPNAYDPTDWETIPVAVPQRFDLCYTGSMYSGRRSPDILFAALADLRRCGDTAGTNARVHFYGPDSDNVKESASQFGVSLMVRQHGVVPRASAMQAQRASAVLLIFLNMDPQTSGEMGSKYLEYLGARRPMLVFGPPDSVMRSFIEDHRLGWFASNVDEAKQALREAYARYVSKMYDLRADWRDLPTAPVMAARFADLLEGVAGTSSVKNRAAAF